MRRFLTRFWTRFWTVLSVIGALSVIGWILPAAAADDLATGLQAYDGGDYAGALAAWRRAAEAGDPRAMGAIANLYLQGEGVRPDAATAASWYRRAADRGDAAAQLNLGDMFSRGIGVPRDRMEAYVWLSLAAAQGNAWAGGRLRDVAASMTAAQIAEARARLAGWRPKAD